MASYKTKAEMPEDLFSATDIVRAINDEDDYKKCRNYWKYLKGKMAKDGVELVSVPNHLKFEAPDGKQRFADALDDTCVQTLAKPSIGARLTRKRIWMPCIEARLMLLVLKHC